MILFVTICFSAIIFACIAGLQNGRWDKIVYLSFFLIWVLLAFQNDCGLDIENYRTYFEKWSGNYTPHLNGLRLSDTRIEYGWYLFNRFFCYLGGFRFFLSLLMLFVVFVLGSLIRKNVPSQYYWFSISVFVFNSYYLLFFSSAIRQATCVIISLLVFNILFSEKEMRYKWPLIIALSIISFSFHQSSIVSLPIYLLVYIYNRQINYKLLIYTSLTLYIVIAILPVEQIIDQINLIVAESGIHKYENKIIGINIYSFAHNVYYFILLFLVLDSLRFYDIQSRKNDNSQVVITDLVTISVDRAFRAMFLLVAFSVLSEQFFRFGGAAHRIIHYFDIFGIVVYPLIILRYKKDNIWMPIIVASLLLFRFISTYWDFLSNYQGVKYLNFIISFD